MPAALHLGSSFDQGAVIDMTPHPLAHLLSRPEVRDGVPLNFRASDSDPKTLDLTNDAVTVRLALLPDAVVGVDCSRYRAS